MQYARLNKVKSTRWITCTAAAHSTSSSTAQAVLALIIAVCAAVPIVAISTEKPVISRQRLAAGLAGVYGPSDQGSS